MRRAVLVLLAVLAIFRGVAAQQEPGTRLQVYLLTMGQGVEVYERFGHNAIWIRDTAMNTDTAYNWGEFSFDQPHFIQNFLKGKMLYWMGAQPLDFMMYVYQVRQRSMWAQELNLTPAQKQQLLDFVRTNALESNKYYTYDYYRDNCSTRVRDVLDRILGGTLQRTLKARPADATYRSETRRLMLADITPTETLQQFPQSPHSEGKLGLTNIALVTGMDLAMGPRIDQPLTQWEASFIPMRLREYVRDLTITGPNGQQQPLVLSERQLVDAHRPDPPAQPPALLKWYIIAGSVLAGLFVLAGSQLGRGWGRALFFVLAGLWTFVIGLVGTLIGGLWAFTDHVVTYGNENLLQANPIALVLFVALLGVLLKQSLGTQDCAAHEPGSGRSFDFWFPDSGAARCRSGERDHHRAAAAGAGRNRLGAVPLAERGADLECLTSGIFPSRAAMCSCRNPRREWCCSTRGAVSTTRSMMSVRAYGSCATARRAARTSRMCCSPSTRWSPTYCSPISTTFWTGSTRRG